MSSVTVSVPLLSHPLKVYSDIRQIRYDISWRIVCITLVLSAGFCLIDVFMVKRIVKPLKKLTEASQKLADRNYDIEPIHSDTYEIQLLSAAFENMAMNLREHEKLQTSSKTILHNNHFGQNIKKQSFMPIVPRNIRTE